MNKAKNIGMILLVVMVLIATYGFFKITSLKKQLKTSEDKASGMFKKVSEYDELLRIDSLLVLGEYDSAINAYTSQLSDKDVEEASGIQLRIDIAKKLSNLNRSQQFSELDLTEKDSLDSIQNVRISSIPREIKQYDSLNFVLEKTKVELVGIKRQLQRKSFGEYITFTNKKGSQFHYVGEVKNNKANGYGIALLNTGSRYEGEWKDNQRHGEGNFYWADGEHYSGNYINDQRTGYGTYYWPNGEKYTGQWKDDKRNGEGVFYGADNQVVTQGIWKNDKLVEEDKSKS
ncbi:hypothetical protein LV716_00470 [Flagellimonas sp. HMM57]|uniref:MORN repeat-containing protein n=1 Tax=unclassified Flagellimonas TaxID=2644544 RepID=UPI0013D11BFC|nr:MULTISPECIES: hypothetical protein [unclassified Flagellimonas]UII76302.1 hypothetical protein LV716_00470 [Flagellimonas sp. HMM57]